MYARIVCRAGDALAVSVVGSDDADLSIRTDPGQAMVMLHGKDAGSQPKAVALMTAATLVSIVMSDDKPQESASA